MYVGLYPCAECARAIIQSGLKSVNTFAPPSDDSIFKKSFQIADEMFREAEIDIFIYDPMI
jgi:dCMP deaminase